ncbi:SET domain protein, partial [Ostertagia ostertagi]
MKDFERKRLEEKARKANEAAAAASLESTLSNVVSTTSEVPSATEKPPEQNSIVHSSGHIVRGPSTPADSPEQPRSEDCEKEGMGCELPSSSVEVPPVPAYEEIEECIYRVDNKKKAMSLMCFCRGNNLDCSDSRCDNRAMFTECPRNCLGKGKDCGNRRFSKREYAAVQAFYTGPNKGFGVQAVAPIKKGQFIIEYVGEVVSSEEFAKRLRRYGRDPSHTHHYMFEIGSMIIDATKKGNCSRFMNHSCEPNAVCEKWYVPRTPCAIDRIGFFAKRDIELGEEITFDYQFENYGREAQRCFCGAASCSGWIGKPPEALDDDTMDEEIESLVTKVKKAAMRTSSHDNVTVAEVQKRLVKALESGCRNKTHVLGWIKLMAEMSLIKNECGIVQSMCRIVEAISSVDTSLQHIFVANGLPSIIQILAATSNPQCLTREDLELKHCIIRSLLAMQSCAEGIN